MTVASFGQKAHKGYQMSDSENIAATIDRAEKQRLAKEAKRIREWRKNNPEKALAFHQAWRDANREAYNAWYRDHYAKNRERILAGQKRRRLEKQGKR